MEKLNVLIIEKSLFYKNMLVRSIENTGLGVVPQFASTGAMAFEKLKNTKFDVVLFDIEWPGEEAADITIARLIREFPEVSVILMASEKEKRKELPFIDVLEYIKKPGPANEEICIESLKKQLQGMFTLILTGRYTKGGFSGSDPKEYHAVSTGVTKNIIKEPPRKYPGNIDLVVIASSTGGPSALENVLKKIPAGFNRPVLVVQHMPEELTKRLSQSLDKKCSLNVMEAEEGIQLSPGTVLIAPGGFHMTVRPGNSGKMIIALETSPPVNGVKPSADVLLYSVARHFSGKGILAVILTGMGSDGMQGVREVKRQCDCYCIAQSENTCVVYGMPKSIVDAGLSDKIEDLELISSAMIKVVSGRGNANDF